MSTLLCQTVTGRTMAELIAARDAADGGDVGGDMVELRLDYVDRPDVAGALAGRRKPVIVTVRAAWEGGQFSGSEEERKQLLRQALEQGAEYVDVEWRAGFTDLIRDFPSRVLVSSHDFAGVPTDLVDRARAMRQTGAGLIKVAVMVTRLVETLPLIDIARGGDAVVLGMGDAGLPSRLLAARFGSRWTYGGDAVAPGQIPADRMTQEYRFKEIGPDTAIYGVVGSNAIHSFSPAMHNAAFGAAGIDAVYVPFRPATFKDFFVFASVLDVRGASVTIPYKVDALWWPSITADARTLAIGAANTLRRQRGPAQAGPHEEGPAQAGPHEEGWEATNTDVEGFLAPLELAYEGPLRNARASVLGAGGAARAVVAALVDRGAQVTVHARRPEQAREVADTFAARVGNVTPAPGSWDVLVNCTPLGGAAAREESPLPVGPFDGRLVYDLTYGPAESRLVRDARAAGCATLDGLPMLVAQAERQFAWWTGQQAPEGVMRAAVMRSVGPERPAGI